MASARAPRSDLLASTPPGAGRAQQLGFRCASGSFGTHFTSDAVPRMDIRETLALNLRTIRRARGLSQEELAHRAEIDRTYVSALERSVYAAGIDVLDRLAKALGVEAADLLRVPPSRQGRGRKGT